jgi:hypothetical protein
LQKNQNRLLLVGDNPFHGISHLSQERVISRGASATDPHYAANLVATSIQRGANGFMFSVSDTTLSILNLLSTNTSMDQVNIYALVPYAYEYVRLATHAGGIPGLGKNMAKQIVKSRNATAAFFGLKGILTTNGIDLLKAYLAYEISRIKRSIHKKGIVQCMLLHEVVTDMCLALNIDSIFKSYIEFLNSRGIKPGFETRNFPFLVKKFADWGIDADQTLIAAPFNKIGFYMNPSKIECESALKTLTEPNVIAMSILAAGYLKPSDATEYVDSLPNINAVVVGVSKENQAREISQFQANGSHSMTSQLEFQRAQHLV